MTRDDILRDLPARAGRAVARYWETRASQRKKQRQTGKADQGLRSAVTGGAQMDGFLDLFTELITAAGIPEQCVFRKKDAELPGHFRPSKKWDLVVVHKNTLLAAIEAKAEAGSALGNNLNTCMEEAMGRALDLWAAYRARTLLHTPQPFLGYFFMLEDCKATNRPVGVQEPHFKVHQEFSGASWIRRYELFCNRLVLDRHYSASAFITSSAESGPPGRFTGYGEDLSIEGFTKRLFGHVAAFA